MGLNVAVLANLKQNAPHYDGMPGDVQIGRAHV